MITLSSIAIEKLALVFWLNRFAFPNAEILIKNTCLLPSLATETSLFFYPTIYDLRDTTHGELWRRNEEPHNKLLLHSVTLCTSFLKQVCLQNMSQEYIVWIYRERKTWKTDCKSSHPSTENRIWSSELQLPVNKYDIGTEYVIWFNNTCKLIEAK